MNTHGFWVPQMIRPYAFGTGKAELVFQSWLVTTIMSCVPNSTLQMIWLFLLLLIRLSESGIFLVSWWFFSFYIHSFATLQFFFTFSRFEKEECCSRTRRFGRSSSQSRCYRPFRPSWRNRTSRSWGSRSRCQLGDVPPNYAARDFRSWRPSNKVVENERIQGLLIDYFSFHKFVCQNRNSRIFFCLLT